MAFNWADILIELGTGDPVWSFLEIFAAEFDWSINYQLKINTCRLFLVDWMTDCVIDKNY